ncbi:Solute carrier family 35 member G1 [Orchesella cincta]|uniref:Solute carrier family 35 member G1 n=1 Tax=Orchesella cincta TaxID=48709 RepID=A0A1D2NGA6_ORCCI|nr:Solute carrier family 35 member G1 [Orchesella cincta]
MTILDTESGEYSAEESGEGVIMSSEHTPLLFPSLKPTLNYRDLHGVHYGTRENSKTVDGRKADGFGQTPVRKPCRKYLGILLAISASFLLSLTTLIARVLIEYHPFNEALWRFLGILLPSVPVLFWSSFSSKEPVFHTVYPLCDREKLKTLLVIFVRAFCGCTAVIFQFYALNYIEIGDVTVISFTTPVFVSILAYFFLGEKLGIVPVLIAFVTLIGIGIIARPPILSGTQEFDPLNLIGVALALGCMGFATFTYVALRWLKPVHYALVTFFYGLISVIECGICAISIGVFQFPLTLEHWLLAFGLGALAFAGQSLFTLALKFEDAGPVALIRTCEVIFTFLWQIMFLGQLPDAFSVIGAFLILLCVLLTTLRKLVMELPDESPMKARFQFLLK